MASGRPIGKISEFKQLDWEDQMSAIRMYLKFGVYPPEILIDTDFLTKKNRKRGFRKMCEAYEIKDNKLRQLKITRRNKDSASESKRFFFYNTEVNC